MSNLKYILFTFGRGYDVDERVLYGWENIDDGDDAAKKTDSGKFCKVEITLVPGFIFLHVIISIIFMVIYCFMIEIMI